MTPHQQVQQELQKEFDKFQMAVYSGKVDVPDNFIEVFKKAVMVLPPQSHKVLFSKIKSISEKKGSKLTYGELADVVKIIVNAPVNVMFANFDTAVDEMKKIEKFILCFNETGSDFTDKLEMKRATLLDLSGANGGSVNGSRMKIIN